MDFALALLQVSIIVATIGLGACAGAYTHPSMKKETA